MAITLGQLSQVSCLKVFVEVDPSHPVFERFRKSPSFYTDFAGNLLKDVLVALPQAKFVQVDGYPSVQMDGPLVSRLVIEIKAQGRILKWGEEGWDCRPRAHQMYL